MATMTVRIAGGKHARIRKLADTHGVSVNKLVNEWASMALAQCDAKTRFAMRAARGDVSRGLSLLDTLDRHDERRGASRKSAKR